MRNDKKQRCVLTSVIESEMNILKRHIHVLKTLKENQPMGIIKLSELTNYPQHMVRYSLRILEQDGLIEPSPQGAITTDEVSKTMNLLKKILGENERVAAGNGCLLIKRRVFEAYSPHYEPLRFRYEKGLPGSDILFFMDAQEIGFSARIHGDIVCGHLPNYPLDENI